MIELLGNTQTVAANANVLYDTVTVKCGCSERHRANSGIVTLVFPGRYKVSFSGNVSTPTGGTAGAVSFAISLNGEQLTEATMTTTTAAVNEPMNISTSVFINVPRCGCCQNISVENIGMANISISNANLLVEKVC